MAPKRGRQNEQDDGEEEEETRNESRRTQFAVHLKALNSQFGRWVQEQAGAHAGELWVPGVKDYLSHAEQLLKDFSDVLDAERSAGSNGAPAPPPAAGWGSGGGAFGSKDSTFGSFGSKDGGSGGKEGRTGGKEGGAGLRAFAFGTPATEPAVTAFGVTASGGAAFGVTASSTREVAFGSAAVASPLAMAPSRFELSAGTAKPADAAPAPAAAFSFGGGSSSGVAATGEKADPAASSAAWSFQPSTSNAIGAPSFMTGATGGFGGFGGGAGGFAFGGAAVHPSGAEAAADEEAEEPQKYQSEVAVNEEAGTVLLQLKSKLHHLKAGQWEHKGVGQLMLRAPKDDPAKPFVTFTTEAGRVLYIANVHKSMKVIVNDAKNTVSWSAAWAPEAGATPTLQSMQAQLPKGKAAVFGQEVAKVQATME